MQNFLFYLVKIFKAKWYLRSPKKNNLLVFDFQSLHILKYIIKKKQFNFFFTRYERIYLFVLLKTIIRYGFQQLILNYTITYINAVKPKVIITAVDNYLLIYRLKKYFPLIKIIVIQNGRRNDSFFFLCKKYYQNSEISLEVDFFFVLGKNDIFRFRKYIKAKYFVIGVVKNNFFYLKKKNKKNKKKIIFFLSKKSNFLMYKNEKNIFNNVYKYSKEKNFKLILCTRCDKNKEKNYRDFLIKGAWSFLPFSDYNSYNAINYSDLIVFSNTTLGYEALSKKKKAYCIVRTSKPFWIDGYDKKYSIKGFFWSNNFKYTKLKGSLDKVLKCSNKNWNAKIKTSISNLIYYNPGNSVFFKKTIDLI